MSKRMKDNGRGQIIFDEFKLYFPSIAKESIKEWYLSDDGEITIEYEDGGLVIYDNVDHTMRYISPDHKNFRLEDLDENRWRSEFGQRLCRMMRYNGINQKELSELSGISEHTISSYTLGRSTPSAYTLSRLARAFECQIEDLIKFEELYK